MFGFFKNILVYNLILVTQFSNLLAKQNKFK